MKKTVEENKDQTEPSSSGNSIQTNVYQSCQPINGGVPPANCLVPPHYLSPILNTQQALLRPLMTTAPPLYSPILSNAVQHSLPLHHHSISGSQMNGTDGYRSISEIENICNTVNGYAEKALSSEKQCTATSNSNKSALNEMGNTFPYQGSGEHSKCNFHEHRLIDEYVKMYGEDGSKFWQEAGLCPIGTQSPSYIKPGPSSSSCGYINSKNDPSWNKVLAGGHEIQSGVPVKDNNSHLQGSTGSHVSSVDSSTQRSIDYQSLSASQLASILPYLQHYPYQIQDERNDLKSNEVKQNVQMCNASTSTQQTVDNSFKKFGPCNFNGQEATSQPTNSKKCTENHTKLNVTNATLPSFPPTSLVYTRENVPQTRSTMDCGFHPNSAANTTGWNSPAKSQNKSLPKNINECKKKQSKQLERPQICCICNSTLDTNQQGCIDSLMTVPSKISVSDKISVILGYPLPRDAMNNIAICPKCYHLVNEVDVLEHRLNLCRREVMLSLESSFERNGFPVNFYKKQHAQNNFGYLQQHNENQNLYCQGFITHAQQTHNHATQTQYHTDQLGNILTAFCTNHPGYGDHNGQCFPANLMQSSGAIPNDHQIGIVQMDNNMNTFHGPPVQDTLSICQQHISGGNQLNPNSQSNHAPVMQSPIVNGNVSNVHMSSTSHTTGLNHHPISVQVQQTNAINYSNCKQFPQQDKTIEGIHASCPVITEGQLAQQPVSDKNQCAPQNLSQKPNASVGETQSFNYQCSHKNGNIPKTVLLPETAAVKYSCHDKISKGGLCVVENLPSNESTVQTMRKNSHNLVQPANNNQANSSQRNPFQENLDSRNILNKPNDLSINQAARFAERNTNYSNCQHNNQGTDTSINVCTSGDNSNNFHLKQSDVNNLTNGIYFSYNEQKMPLTGVQNYNDIHFNTINYNLCTNPQKSNHELHNMPTHQNLCMDASNPQRGNAASSKLVADFPSQNRQPQEINLLPPTKAEKSSWSSGNITLSPSYHPNNIESSSLQHEINLRDKQPKNQCAHDYQSHADGNELQNTLPVTSSYQVVQNDKLESDSAADKRSAKLGNPLNTPENDSSLNQKQNSLEPLRLHSKSSLSDYEKENKIHPKTQVLPANSIIAVLPDEASHSILQDSFGAIVPTYSETSRNFDDSEHIFDTLSHYDEDVNIEDITSKGVAEKCSKDLCLEGSGDSWPDSSFIDPDDGNDSTSKSQIVEGDIDIEECDNLIDNISVTSDEGSSDIAEGALLSIENDSPDEAFSKVDDSDADKSILEPSLPPSPSPAGLDQLMSPASLPPTPAGPPEGLRNVQDATEYHKPTLLGKSIKMKKHAKLQICRQCDQVFSNRQALVRHIERRHKSPFVCTTCNRKFNSEEMLTSHMDVHKNHKCDICGEEFIRKSKLKRHTTTEHSKDHLTCNVCAKVTLSLQALISHSKTHNKKVRNYECDICSKVFASNKNLKNHQLIHSGLLPFKCVNCDRCFRHKSNMLAHNKLCAGTSLFSCDQCEKKFPLKSLHKKHLLEHKGVYSHQCSVCDKGFGKSSDLRYHFRIHITATVISRCRICTTDTNSSCNQTFPQDNLGLVCPVCGKVVKRKDAMKDHISQHEGKRKYLCMQCNEAFFYRSNLKNHIKIVHENRKPYSCSQCSKSFGKSDTYKLHLRTHTGEKPYECYCGKAFSCNSNFKRHKKHHTNTEQD